MKLNKTIIITMFIFILFSCVTTGNNLPEWAEIKPTNTEKEIYFVYGPVESRDRAKEGLYKEISEYFGVNVSSVDKFVKQVSVENGVRDISQTKESQVDVTSREKGLSAIEIREIWSDSSEKRWCILASLSREAEEKIKKEVDAEIEAERVQNVLLLAENYNKDIETKYSSLEAKITKLKKLELQIGQSINKISNVSDSKEIMSQSIEGLKIGDEIDLLISDIKGLTNEIRLNQTKASLLKSQLTDNSVALLELDFFVTESKAIMTKAETKSLDVIKTENSTLEYKDELNRLLQKSELEVLGNEENDKKILYSEIERINTSSKRIILLKDEMELLYNQSEDLLMSLKRNVSSTSIDPENKKAKSNEILLLLNDSFEQAKRNVETVYKLKSSISVDLNSALKSDLITESEGIEIKKRSTEINSPSSWIEIYKDKIGVNLNSGKRIAN